MTTLSSLLTTLQASSLSPHNRLCSIASDAAFIRAAALSVQRPVVANERCGAWYVGADGADASAYFKSTDGHERAWKFSLRRLNLHLLRVAEANDGFLIVDSTRRGKRLPDALSTTIPIWCTSLIPVFVSDLAALGLDLSGYKLSKPLRPLWIGPDSPLPGPGPIFEDYTPVVCCSASRVEDEGERTVGYVQGAADDAENWSLGLTPSIFWRNVDALLAASDTDLPSLIATLMTEAQANKSEASKEPRQLTPTLSVTALPCPPPREKPAR
ncbi:tRNA A64-2'-O-ribosylphosphate transferase [Ophiocordyceps camponoti-floridani]|uniref:tRNA A64-2'-O-ribosylphosphate transferase n=1 Tax=Ophiocordyceps camponoti-floridani TaxID=2030778 RepID=A0A8H4VB92_9HYPO|nr:tRNA A64-2'-O-ribosylphosphate transferase [Ophiocordyceps camponoti-floridani]